MSKATLLDGEYLRVSRELLDGDQVISIELDHAFDLEVTPGQANAGGRERAGLRVRVRISQGTWSELARLLVRSALRDIESHHVNALHMMADELEEEGRSSSARTFVQIADALDARFFDEWMSQRVPGVERLDLDRDGGLDDLVGRWPTLYRMERMTETHYWMRFYHPGSEDLVVQIESDSPIRVLAEREENIGPGHSHQSTGGHKSAQDQ